MVLREERGDLGEREKGRNERARIGQERERRSCDGVEKRDGKEGERPREVEERVSQTRNGREQTCVDPFVLPHANILLLRVFR